jgi:hypothetical protein
MTQISYTAEFSPEAPPAEIFDELTCHACGQRQPGQLPQRIADNQLRIFCDRCGAFTTILLSDAQVRAIRLAAQRG